MRKNCKMESPSFTRSEKGPETKARGEQEDARRGRRTEPARLYPQRAPDSMKLTQTTHERNQAELPMRLGGLGHSRWQDTGPSLQENSEGTRASSESSEPVPCGKRCRRCSHSRKSGPRRETPSLLAYKSPTRSSLTPGCGIIRSQLHAQPEPYAEVARCEVGACPEKRQEP